MKKEKEEKSAQEKIRERQRILVLVSFGMIIIGAMLAIAPIAESGTYQKLRADDYMSDPTIPYNERDNATYSFSDDWLKDARDRIMWWAIPGAIVLIIGYALIFLSEYPLSDKELHRTLCKKWESEPVSKHFKYCPECGLKLSKLEKK